MDEERIMIIQTMIDNNGIEEGEFAEYEKEALQSLLDSYKIQRKQLNDALDNGRVHKEVIKNIIDKLENKKKKHTDYYLNICEVIKIFERILKEKRNV